jgi:molybdate transport repressor ModE-like protein
MNVNLDQLEVLEAIDRLGSFSAAAKELHRATSAVSYAIKTLEDLLGVEIYDRSGHRAQLTDSGRVILYEGREVLERARKMELVAAQLQQGWEPRLTLIVDGVLPMLPAIRSLKRFIQEGLPTKVSLQTDYLAGVRERFDSDKHAMMLTVDQPSEKNLIVQPLGPIEMLLLAHREHGLHQLKKPLAREDFQPFVELLVSPSAGKQMNHIQKLYFHVPHTFELSDFQSKRVALQAGVGFGWMPAHFVDDLIDDNTLKPVGFEEGDSFLFTPQLVYRKDPPPGKAARLFAQYLIEASAPDFVAF